MIFLIKNNKKNIKQFLVVFLMVFWGTALFAGFLNAESIERSAIDDYYSRYNLPDIWMNYSRITEENLKRIREIDGIKATQKRYLYDFSMENKDGNFSRLKVMSYQEGDLQSKPYICEGKMPCKSGEILLDLEYARVNEITIGEAVSITLNAKTISAIVTGYMESVEYPAKIPDSYSDIPDSETYGIAYLHVDTFEEEFGNDILPNQILIDVEDEERTDEIAYDLKNLEGENELLYITTRNGNMGYELLYSAIDSNRQYSLLCFVVFYSISALLIFVTTKNMLMLHKKQVGIMRALGIKVSWIKGQYTVMPIIVSFAGTLLGGMMGERIVPEVMIYSIEKQVDVAVIKKCIYPQYIFLSMVVMLVLAIVSVLFACKKIGMESIVDLLKDEPGMRGIHVALEKFPKIWDGLGNRTQILVRNLMRSKGKSISVIAGIAVSVAVMMTGIGLFQSVELLNRLQYKDIMKADAVVKMSYESIQDNGVVVKVDPYRSLLLEGMLNVLYTDILCQFMDSKGQAITGELIAFHDENKRMLLYGILDENNKPVHVKQNGIIISKTLSNRLQLKIGESVSFWTVDCHFERKEIKAEIVGISNQYYSQEIYCSEEFLNENGIKPMPVNSYVSFDNSDIDYETFQKILLKRKEVNNVKSVNVIAENMKEYCKDTIYDVVIFGVIAFAIVFAVISCSSSMKFLERKKEIVIMKELGYDSWEIAGLFVRENVVLILIGALIGIPLGIEILQMMFGAHEVGDNMFPVPEYHINAVVSFSVVSICAWICSYGVVRKIKGLRCEEIGR